MRPQLFDPDAQITAVSADLSPFGGSASAALDRQADGTYALEPPLQTPGQNGFYPLSVIIDQQTLLGPYWIQLSRPVVVLTDGDAQIFAEGLAPGWTLARGDVVQVAPFDGRPAAWLANRTDLNFQTETPLPAVGYTALHFAFHPGDATAAATDFCRYSSTENRP
ncbi:MAG: hypothetical protein GKR89_28400 [Candidatus Latescibacteria bacterium]|nr:hypothetical protein [Candidatus Latescibacterota bacterium]